MKAILADKGTSQSDKILLNFCLGKIHDDCKHYDRAFEYFRKGNELKRQELNINQLRDKNEIESIIQVFNNDLFVQLKEYGSVSEKPVFIVGMPRSGTSLVEQILASHHKVYGAGELKKMSQLVEEISRQASYPKCVKEFTKIDIAKNAQKYMDYTCQLAGEKWARVTDKMPWNFMQLGLIAILFPKAKIVHCIRDSFDTCLSNYFQIFEHGNPYSYDLGAIGAVYKEYERLMSHWRRVLPLKVLDVCYEEIVTDTENQAKRLINFLGLDWEESCLDFYRTKREVKTASLWQVRQPVYKSSAKRWKNYEAYLGPLKAVFGAGRS